MIAARPRPLFGRLFAVYTAWTVRRHFRAVFVRGSLPETRAPLLVVAQHAGWWDPMILFQLSRCRFGGRHETMMDEANLRRLGFFRWLGAFGIDRSSRSGQLASLRYALARLREPDTRVWIFPQGAIVPVDRRPLGCDAGAGWLAARARVPVVAVAIRYEFREAQYAEAFVSFSEPRILTSRIDADGADAVESMLTEASDQLRDDVWNGRLDAFDRVVDGRRSINQRTSGGPGAGTPERGRT